MITLIVRSGISPAGTLFVALARHSLGGTDCKKCSMAGKSSEGSNKCFSRSPGIFRANFQTHFSTNSATLASRESGCVPFDGNGLTTCNRRPNKALTRNDQPELPPRRTLTHRKTTMRRPVANSRRIIMLINRERSFTFESWLSSVWSNRDVNSSNKAVTISTVSDSASMG